MEEKIKAASAAEESTQNEKPVRPPQDKADSAVGSGEEGGQPRKTTSSRKPRAAAAKKQGGGEKATDGPAEAGENTPAAKAADAAATKVAADTSGRAAGDAARKAAGGSDAGQESVAAQETADGKKPQAAKRKPASRKKEGAAGAEAPKKEKTAAQDAEPAAAGKSAGDQPTPTGAAAASDTDAAPAAPKPRRRSAAKPKAVAESDAVADSSDDAKSVPESRKKTSEEKNGGEKTADARTNNDGAVSVGSADRSGGRQAADVKTPETAAADQPRDGKDTAQTEKSAEGAQAAGGNNNARRKPKAPRDSEGDTAAADAPQAAKPADREVAHEGALGREKAAAHEVTPDAEDAGSPHGEDGGEHKPSSRRRRRGGRGRGGRSSSEASANAGAETDAQPEQAHKPSQPEHESSHSERAEQPDAPQEHDADSAQEAAQGGGSSKSRSRRKKKHPQAAAGDPAAKDAVSEQAARPEKQQKQPDAKPEKQQKQSDAKPKNGAGNRGGEQAAKPVHRADENLDKELIINVTPAEITIALLEDKQLVELNKEKCRTGFAVGDIYLGKVRKIMPGLNAAFVSIGHEKDAFIHYLDLGPQFTTLHKLTGQLTGNKKAPKFETLKLDQPINKKGKISGFLSSGQPILVQIAKEAISTKGPRLTSDVSLAGRHVVLIPFSNKVNVSQKIRSNEEKKRLKKIIEGVLPHNYGVIIRTAAQGKSQTDLENDINSLVARWESALEAMRDAAPPRLLLSEMNRATTIIRDLLNGSFSSIVVDDKSLYEEIREYIKTIAPEKEKIVKLYKGRIPIFDNYDISKQIKGLFAKYVSLRKGAYLIVEHTEAMHVVDVNSGNRAKVADDQEQTAMEVNLAAASEIARQLRLRDMGGIIVIDFIDLHRSENRNALHHKMTELMSSDRAKHTILPISKFGLMQITRQRVRPEAIAEETETCPACGGTGTITPTANLDEQIENRIAYFVSEHGLKYIKLRVSPYVEAYLKKGFPSKRRQWQRRHKVRIEIVTDQSTGFVETKYFDNQDNELI